MRSEEQKMAAAVGERDADRIIEDQLKGRVVALEDAGQADVLTYFGPIYPMAGELVKEAVEALPDKRNGVLFLLETGGGLIDVAERIAIILRHKYKFKNWRKTQTNGTKVTQQMRKDRAADIARKLNETNRWHSHSRGISIQVLRRDLKLLIDDLGDDAVLGPAIQSYYHLLKDYTVKRGYRGVALHTRERYVGY